MWYIELPNGEIFILKTAAELTTFLNGRKVIKALVSFVPVYEPPTKQVEERKDRIVEPTPLSR